MQLEWAEKIVKAGQEMDLDLTLREGYNGRGMFFRSTTAGVVGNFGDIIQAIAAVAVDLAEEQHYDESINVDAFIRNMNLRVDNMGKEYILY